MKQRFIPIEEKIQNSLSLQTTQRFLRHTLKLVKTDYDYLVSKAFVSKLSAWDNAKKTLFYQNVAGPINKKQVTEFYNKKLNTYENSI